MKAHVMAAAAVAFVLAGGLAGAGAGAGVAEAAGARVRSGVPVDSLTPSGLTRGEVVAPASRNEPVRIVYAGDDGKPAVMMHVLVGADAAEARAALEQVRRGVSRVDAAAERSDLGDVGFGSGRIVGFVKDNVMVVVQRVGAGAGGAAAGAGARAGADVTEAEDLARAALAAVEAAPTATSARVPQASKPAIVVAKRGLRGGEIARVSITGDTIATRAFATGAGHIRARADGSWSLIRTRDGDIETTIIAVDPMLHIFIHAR